jgi:hypothetical protein
MYDPQLESETSIAGVGRFVNCSLWRSILDILVISQPGHDLLRYRVVCNIRCHRPINNIARRWVPVDVVNFRMPFLMVDVMSLQRLQRIDELDPTLAPRKSLYMPT